MQDKSTRQLHFIRFRGEPRHHYKERKKLLQLATKEQGQWTSPFSADDLGENDLKVTTTLEDDSEKNMIYRVNVTPIQATIFITVTRNVGPAPYRIENHFNDDVIVYQSTTPMDQMIIEKRISYPFVWNQIYNPDRTLTVYYNGYKREIDMRSIGDVEILRYSESTQKNSPRGALALRVAIESSTIILKINRIEPVDEPREGSGDKKVRKLLKNTERGRELQEKREKLTLKQENFNVTVNLKGFEISIIDNKPLEILYLTLNDLRFAFSDSNMDQTAVLTIDRFQIDDQLVGAEYDVVLYKVPRREELEEERDIRTRRERVLAQNRARAEAERRRETKVSKQTVQTSEGVQQIQETRIREDKGKAVLRSNEGRESITGKETISTYQRPELEQAPQIFSENEFGEQEEEEDVKLFQVKIEHGESSDSASKRTQPTMKTRKVNYQTLPPLRVIRGNPKQPCLTEDIGPEEAVNSHINILVKLPPQGEHFKEERDIEEERLLDLRRLKKKEPVHEDKEKAALLFNVEVPITEKAPKPAIPLSNNEIEEEETALLLKIDFSTSEMSRSSKKKTSSDESEEETASSDPRQSVPKNPDLSNQSKGPTEELDDNITPHMDQIQEIRQEDKLNPNKKPEVKVAHMKVPAGDKAPHVQTEEIEEVTVDEQGQSKKKKAEKTIKTEKFAKLDPNKDEKPDLALKSQHLFVSFKKLKNLVGATGILAFQYFTAFLQETDLELSETLMLRVQEFVKTFTTESDNPQIADTSLEFKKPPKNDRISKMYFEVFQIQPMRINITFTRGIEKFELFNEPWPLQLLFDVVTNTVGNVDAAPIRLNGVVMNRLLSDEFFLAESLRKHYTRQFIKEAYKILGSIEVIGNPVGVFTNISSGFEDFFMNPSMLLAEVHENLQKDLEKESAHWVRKLLDLHSVHQHRSPAALVKD